ncbi:MAG: diaminopimelate epimerase [Candidatus Rokubacteria bacterium 13_1_40CM_69_27]|nr:MAG: diaminopimelate epimerase [Candidatus Rokubacteria bacterium 13_1_40CM_69_27]OLE38612.1 MAG: diaminopimelate epimerase [Candidatus Rokubacteria bacterium 13_1_20CM_2_70_7]
MIPFAKGHGLGNDYLVIDQRDLPGPLSSRAIATICDRNRGVGSDGILLLVPATRADFGLRIFNPDGSEAEKSGNGLRIFAKYLWDHGHAKQAAFTVETKGGVVECQLHVDQGRVNFVTVEMGRVTFRAPEIPMNGPDRDVVAVPLQLADGTALRVTAVSIGNPHCVVFVERLDEAQCRRLGPMIEQHPAFPNRTNVQFARVRARDGLDILIWERGAGFTLASGSSSCGAASAAVRNGFCDHGRVTVRMPGGELAVHVRADWSLRLEGPVEEVCTGTLTREFVEAYVSPG